MELLAKLIDLIAEFILDILPFKIVKQYEHGVVLRVGRYHKNIEAGWHWKIPFFDDVMLCKNTITTLETGTQSLTTADDKNVTLSAIVKYKISNPKKFLLEVTDATDAISDITQGKIKQLLANKSWLEAKELKEEEIKDLAGKECTEWGIKIIYVTITSLTQARVYKLYNSNEQ